MWCGRWAIELLFLSDIPTSVFVSALKDPNAHVRTQAVIALARLGPQGSGAGASRALPPEAPLVEDETELAIEPRAATANVKATAATRLNPLSADITGAKKLFLVVTDGGNGNRFDYADWVEPLLSGPAGDRKLTELAWAGASAGWSEVRVGANALGQPLSVDGQPVPWGLGTHAVSVISYDLPDGHGWTTFSAKGALDDSSVKQRRQTGSVQFHVYVDALPPEFRGESARAAAVAVDSRRALPHLASRALIALGAHEACFVALDTSASNPGNSRRRAPSAPEPASA